MNHAGMFPVIARNGPEDDPDDHGVELTRSIAHLEHSPGQFVAVSLLEIGRLELLEGHPAAVVGRSDAKGRGDGGHDGEISR